MENNKLSETADLLKAAIENEDREHFGLEKLGVKLCIDEENRCIDVLINDLCLASLFEFTFEAADLYNYGCLIRHAAIIASCSYARGRKDEAIELQRIMTWEKMGKELEEQNNG